MATQTQIGIALLLLLSSCGTKKVTQQSHRMEDTLTHHHRRTERIEYLPVPPSRAELSLPLARVAQLPEGSEYAARSTGQARVQAKRKGDTLYITATCDSLQQLVLTYREEVDSLRHRLSEERKKRTITTSWGEWLRGLGVVLIPALLVVGLFAWMGKRF